jgi:hypothetical protein
MKKLIIDIDTLTGDFTAEACGFHGKACKKLMDELLESSTTKTERLKREYADRETEREVQKA